MGCSVFSLFYKSPPTQRVNTAADRRSCRKTDIRVARPHPDVLPPSLPPLGSIGAVRVFFRHRVRAVHRIWQTERSVRQAGLATPHRWGKTIGAVGHPSDQPTKPSCTVRAHRRGRWRRPVAAAARTHRLAWAATQNSTTRRRTELVVDRAPLPVVRPS